MDNQNKFVTKWATWVITPDGYVYVGSVIDGSEEVWRDRHEEMMKKPDWNGYKFICVPIAIPIPDGVVNKVITE